MALVTVADFRLAVLNELPQLRGVLDPDVASNPVSALLDLTRRAKDAQDWETYGRCIRLVDNQLPRASADLENALYVSFLAHLDFADPERQKAWSLLTPQLQAAWLRLKHVPNQPPPKQFRDLLLEGIVDWAIERELDDLL